MTFGDIIRSFATPGGSPRDLAWDGKTFWHTKDDTDRIYQFDPSTLKIIRSFAAPATGTSGITFDGKYLWVSDNITDLAYQIDPTDGKVIRTIPLPGASPIALSWYVKTLWTIDNAGPTLYQMDLFGNVIRSLATSTGNSPGIETYDGRLWFTSLSNALILEYDIGTLLEIRRTASPGASPVGIVFDGKYLWNADTTEDRIYQLALS